MIPIRRKLYVKAENKVTGKDVPEKCKHKERWNSNIIMGQNRI